MDTVGEEIKRLLGIFQKRNPMFSGKCSVCGHSLGNENSSLCFIWRVFSVKFQIGIRQFKHPIQLFKPSVWKFTQFKHSFR